MQATQCYVVKLHSGVLLLFNGAVSAQMLNSSPQTHSTLVNSYSDFHMSSCERLTTEPVSVQRTCAATSR